jgi:hypothetical protein
MQKTAKTAKRRQDFIVTVRAKKGERRALDKERVAHFSDESTLAGANCFGGA